MRSNPSSTKPNGDFANAVSGDVSSKVQPAYDSVVLLPHKNLYLSQGCLPHLSQLLPAEGGRWDVVLVPVAVASLEVKHLEETWYKNFRNCLLWSLTINGQAYIARNHDVIFSINLY